MIDAQHKSEERYCKLALAYESEEEKKKILDAINSGVKICHMEPNIYKSDLTHNKKAIILEYHDDINRESGVVFDKILDSLNIKKCQE